MDKKSVLMTVVLVGVLSLVVVGAAEGAVIIVKADGTGDYPTIQAAIDASGNGDEIVVTDGIYTGIGNKNLDFGGRSITVRSENGPDTTIIDCENSGRGFNFHNNENDSSILNGFTITNGWAWKGGGITCSSSSPIINNCLITRNYGREDGGGMYNSNSSPILSNCKFVNNTAYYWYGGGIYNNSSAPRITNCTFSGNSATWGGGISNRNYSSPIISSCVFTDNYASQLGGGIDTSYSSPLVEKCIFSLNDAGDSGGGIDVGYSSAPKIKSCLFTCNKAGRGGGIGNFSGFEFTISNCTFYGNIARGSNRGGFIYNHRPLSIIENCIIWNNTSPEIVGDGSVLSFSCIKGGWPGIGNIDDDPLFVDPNGADGIIGTGDDNLRPHADSPCINTGDPNYIAEPNETDLDGKGRVFKDIVDMGAYEFDYEGPILSSSPTEFSFSAYTLWPNPEPQLLKIKNSGSGIVNWEITESCLWLDVYPLVGDSNGNINEVILTVDTSTLSVGSYTSELTITADGCLYSPIIVPVTLDIFEPVLGYSPSSFDLFMLEGDIDPINEILSIFNNGDGTMQWEIIEDCSWLEVIPASGETTDETDEVTLGFDISSLTPGEYTCELIISSNNAVNAPQSIVISLYIHSEGIETIYVPSQFPTIQAAVDKAWDGDTIIVDEGTYTGIGNRDLDFGGKAITVRSVDPNDPAIVAATVIDCNGSEEDFHRGFYFHSGEDGNSVVAGFTVVNGYARYGAGIHCEDSSPVITNCNFTGGTAERWGGGIYCASASPVISNCTFTGNSAFEGAAITTIDYSYPVIESCQIFGNTSSGSGGGINSDIWSAPTIANCIITNNFAETYGGGGISIFQSHPTIINCVIADNSSYSSGGGILQWYYFEDGSRIINCTIAGNSAYEAGGIYCSSEMAVVNSIVWGNTSDLGQEVSANDDLTFSYSDVKGSSGSGTGWNGDFGTDGGGNIDDDPCFALVTDYHLMAGSLCIDSGDPNYVAEPNDADVDGNERVLDGDGDGNSVVDMGAYEYNPSSPSIAVSSVSFSCAEGGPKPAAQTLLIRNCGAGILNWEIVEDCNWLEVMPTVGVSTGEIDEITVILDHNGLSPGYYAFVLTVRDPNASNSPVTVHVPVRVGALLEVPDEYETIQDAIDAAEDYDMVLVADGVYTGEGNRDLDYKGKAIIVGSENGAENCIIDCNGTEIEPHRGFYFNKWEDDDSVLDGFTITNGWAERGGGILCYNSSPRITNCTIIGNSSYNEGGGIACNTSSPQISNCTINKNSTERDGGGIHCYDSNPEIMNCNIADNFAVRGGGGGLFCYGGAPTITRCIVKGNSSERDGGGIYCRRSGSDIISCIISGNVAMRGGGIIGCEGKIAHCTIIGNRAWDRGGAMAQCRGEITNCIILGNTVSEGSQLNSCSEPNYSCIEGWTNGGEGNIDADPCFVMAGYWGDVNDVNIVVEPNDANAVWVDGDYHLLEGSPCINAGDPNYTAGPGETDFDGNERVVDGRIDMGAYEFDWPPVEVEVKITPHMLNCQSKGNWVKAHVVLPEGYWPEDIDVNTAAVAEPMGAESEYIKVFDKGKGRSRKGKFGVEIGFDREAFCAAGAESEDGYLEVKVTGWLLTGERFEGTDTIKVISHRWRHRHRESSGKER